MTDPFTTAFSSARAALDMIGVLFKLKSQTDVQAKAIELQTIVLDLQGQLQAIQAAQAAEARRGTELEAEVRALREWSVNAAHYRLHRFEAGGMAYRFQPPDDDESAAHDLCPQCYEQKIKSILQITEPVGWNKALKCHRCNCVVLVERIQASSVTITEQPRNRWRDIL